MKLIIKAKTIYIILSIIIITLLTFKNFAINIGDKHVPKAERGVLDLRNWDLNKTGPLSLNGEWEFYNNQLLSYEDFHSNKPSGYVKVPDVWNHYIIDGKKLDGKGYATYRLKVKLRENDKIPLKGIKTFTMSTTFKLMINDTVVSTNGVVGKTEETSIAEYRPKSAAFITDSNEFEIIIQVSNFLYSRGGIWYKIYFGTDESIRLLDKRLSGMEMILFGSIFIIGLYHLVLYASLREKKYGLYFGIACLISAVRTIVTGETQIVNIIPNISTKLIIFMDYLTLYWGTTVLSKLIESLYPEESNRFINKILIFIASAFTLFETFTPIYVYTKTVIIYEAIIILTCVYIVIIIVRAAIKKREGSISILFGIFFLTITVLNDILYNANKITSTTGSMSSLGTFVLILVLSLSLAKTFSSAFNTIENLSKKLISYDKLKDDFLANTSHELKTPLHGIINITEAVIEESKSLLNKNQLENLSLVVTIGKRLSNMVNDILDFSKLKNSDITLVKTNINLYGFVQVLIELFSHLLGDKPIVIKNSVRSDLPLIHADENRLKQIMYNLVGNAVKFTHKGEIEISAKVKGDMVEISVRDTGIGIPREKIENIFKSFQQPGTEGNAEYGGTGLGLSITKKLVEIHNGQTYVESEYGIGSNFIFTMPISYESSLNDASLQSKNITQNQQAEPPKISFTNNFEKTNIIWKNGESTVLIVDDEYANLRVLISILSREKYNIITASSGEDAIDIIKKNKGIDLVILDLMMPKMSGYEVCRRIRENYSLDSLPVLLLTVKSQVEDIVAGFEAGINDFLSKPVDRNELMARTKTLLTLKKSVSNSISNEMAFLQAQIRPHFLYNTLNSIAGFCITEPEKAAELICEFSNYLRESFDFKNLDKFITLEEEIDLVKSYLAIEKARFQERLNIIYDIDRSLNFEIPPLVIQPLVENAVKHGVMAKLTGGTVKISVHKRTEFYEITVEDDGLGMTQEKLNSVLTDEIVINRGVGIKNIIRRIKNIEGYEFNMESQPSKGTKAIIRIT